VPPDRPQVGFGLQQTMDFILYVIGRFQRFRRIIIAKRLKPLTILIGVEYLPGDTDMSVGNHRIATPLVLA